MFDIFNDMEKSMNNFFNSLDAMFSDNIVDRAIKTFGLEDDRTIVISKLVECGQTAKAKEYYDLSIQVQVIIINNDNI